MIYQGTSLTLSVFSDNNRSFAKLNFDRENDSINKFDQHTLGELSQALDALEKTDNVDALLLTSSKDVFIVGADIKEFQGLFAQDDAVLTDGISEIHKLFNRVEDLPFPTASAINGMALGGGLEICLTTDFRVISETAQVGFPEVKLGILPGWGGTVRTPRMIGVDNAVEWVATGNTFKADKALKVGIADSLVKPELLEKATIDILHKAINGDLNIKAIRKQKTSATQLNDIEMIMAFETCKAMVAQQAGKFFKAPMAATRTMEKSAKLSRDDALKVECENFVKLAKTEIASNLVALFLNDQALSKKAKTLAEPAGKINQAAVLGAGIMGGGIAYQSAYKGTPIRMKDIAQQGLDAGLEEAASLLSKRVNRGRMTPEKMAKTLNNIHPTLNYDQFDEVDVVVEAVVENENVKKSVLQEVEAKVRDNTIIASNTSTIPITTLAKALKRPENFCGMHFFNPVPKMPLVEVIRGEQTSDAAVAATVAYALAMGKKPVVVNDCPGFLVNRVLFAYLNAFVQLVHDGADFTAIDKAATNFGWPMGPAHLCDVVGIDTGVHAGAVMAEGFPERMAQSYKTSLEVLLENDRLGEKNGLGFYRYEKDKKGRPQKQIDDTVTELLKPVVGPAKEFSEQEIIDRLMIPFCFEAVRCLHEGIAESAEDLDMAMAYGIGFPLHRGGVLRYMENIGLQAFCDNAKQYQNLGEHYKPSEKLAEMAQKQQSLFTNDNA